MTSDTLLKYVYGINYLYYQNLYYIMTLQELQPGTKVLVENTYQKERKGGKLEEKYKGPYEIHKSLGKGVYELMSMDGKILKTKHNITRLKVY